MKESECNDGPECNDASECNDSVSVMMQGGCCGLRVSEWNKRTPGVSALEGMGQKGEMLWSESEKFENQMSDILV